MSVSYIVDMPHPPRPRETYVPSQSDDAREIQENEKVGASDQDYGDSSAPLWSLSISESEKYDKVLAESLKGDMDGILIFTGLFAATVAAFVIESYKSLKQDSGDSNVLLLNQILHQLAATSNETLLPLPTPANELPFKPPLAMVHVNVLWFLSLVLSISCALAATLVQQWARKYLQTAQLPTSPHSRARIRAYLYQGVEKFHMSVMADSIPLLLHTAVFFFFAGLVVFLFTVNLTVTYVVLAAVAVCGVLYVVLTVLPLVYRNCPYRTPLSPLLWRLYQAQVMASLILLERVSSRIRPYHRWTLFSLPHYAKRCREQFSGGLRHNLEKVATAHSTEIDHTALNLTLREIRDDSELERFVAGIPGFIASKVVENGWLTVWHLLRDANARLGVRIGRLLATCVDTAIGGLTEDARVHRALTCMDAIWKLTEWFERVRVRCWDLDFGEATVEALQLMKKDKNSDVAVNAWCTSALAARVLSSELAGMTVAAQKDDLRKNIVALISLPTDLRNFYLTPEQGCLSDGPLLVVINFTLGVVPHLRKLNERSLALVWETLRILLKDVDAISASLPVQAAFKDMWRDLDSLFNGQESGAMTLWQRDLPVPSDVDLHVQRASSEFTVAVPEGLRPPPSVRSHPHLPSSSVRMHNAHVRELLNPIVTALDFTD